jgi:hypothetical protein
MLSQQNMKKLPFSKFFYLINLYVLSNFRKIVNRPITRLRVPGETPDSRKNVKLKISRSDSLYCNIFCLQFMRVDWRRARGSPATTPTSTPCGPLPSGRPPPKPSTRQQAQPSQYIQLFTDWTMDQITIKTPSPKCRLCAVFNRVCRLEIQLVTLVFSTGFVKLCPSIPYSPLPCVNKYTVQCTRTPVYNVQWGGADI